VTAQRLCSFMTGKGTLRIEQIEAAERVFEEAMRTRARRIAALLGRESAPAPTPAPDGTAIGA
jgi:hypothetical protein